MSRYVRVVDYDCSHWMSGPGERGVLIFEMSVDDGEVKVIRENRNHRNFAIHTLKSRQDIIEQYLLDGWKQVKS